ncbi:hypothetical protein [Branchiibius sp. NY16-3462-2]|uniref:hypothetical protein n=1 Tax=Branchiibius sp. NY16-3462-2 TaxID=1807500 RepID=UPI00079BE94D|nr:hypothetical protein [Branchiibius sp. NY16-3462-2]KYH45047.1 hypothetical protein AZH51_14265 [Branchiibius sp. NY16-3462-2]
MTFDAAATWPDLFEGLTAEQKSSVDEALTALTSDGYEPGKDEVASIIDGAKQTSIASFGSPAPSTDEGSGAVSW